MGFRAFRPTVRSSHADFSGGISRTHKGHSTFLKPKETTTTVESLGNKGSAKRSYGGGLTGTGKATVAGAGAVGSGAAFSTKKKVKKSMDPFNISKTPKGYTKHQKHEIKRAAGAGAVIGGSYAATKKGALAHAMNSSVPAGSSSLKLTGGEIAAGVGGRGIKGAAKGAAALGGLVAGTNALSNRKRRKNLVKKDNTSAFGVEH